MKIEGEYMCVWTEQKCLAPPIASAAVRFQVSAIWEGAGNEILGGASDAQR